MMVMVAVCRVMSSKAKCDDKAITNLECDLMDAADSLVA